MIRTGAGSPPHRGRPRSSARTRAGAAAVRMARAGTANWRASAPRGRASGAAGAAAHERTNTGRQAPTRPGGTDARPPRSTPPAAAPPGRPVHASPPVGAPGRGETAGRSAAVPQSTSGGTDPAADRIGKPAPGGGQIGRQRHRRPQAGRGRAAAAADRGRELMQTLRRLNDPERYYGLSWRGWLGVAIGGGLLYGAVRVSPLGCGRRSRSSCWCSTFCGVVLHALSGQALGPGRHLRRAGPLRARAQAARAPRPPRPRRPGARRRCPPARAEAIAARDSCCSSAVERDEKGADRVARRAAADRRRSSPTG